MGFTKAALTTACAAWGMLAAVNSATAADEPFYKGKTITFICASAPDGGYDTYSRLIATHIVHHLDGNPSIVVQNMPGAGSIRASNQLYNVVKKDGTFIGMIDQAIYLNQILGTPELKADATKFTWIGRILSNSAVLFASSSAPVMCKRLRHTSNGDVCSSPAAASQSRRIKRCLVSSRGAISSSRSAKCRWMCPPNSSST